MANNSIYSGGLLIVVGVFITIVSDSGSATSLTPAFIGAVFVVIGLVARAKPDWNKHLMHAAAAIALLGVVGSRGALAFGRSSTTAWALVAQITTIVVLSVFLVLAIQSFRAARLAREAEAVPPST